MRNLIIVSSVIITFLSCRTVGVFPKPNWQMIEVPEVSTIYALHGSLENYLLVAGLNGVVKSNDHGKTWKTVLPKIIFGEFRQIEDTLIGVTNDMQDYYSLDRGDSWQIYHANFDVIWRNTVQSSQGELVYKYEPSPTYPKRPDLVFQSSNGGVDWEDMLLDDVYVYSIHLDDSNRLYIGAVGWIWNAVLGTFEDDGRLAGFLYYIE